MQVVMGKGNSAMETADFISNYARATHVLGRSPHTFSWTTHYAPNLRAVNNNFLDTVQVRGPFV
jgi:thioredoxin reductase